MNNYFLAISLAFQVNLNVIKKIQSPFPQLGTKTMLQNLFNDSLSVKVKSADIY